MRLIDADELINQGYEIVVDGWQYDTCNKSIDIDTIPTAYDIDKVVEKLKERKALHERLVDYETKNGTVTEKYQHIKAIDVLNEAIEIVKQGGIRKDVNK